MATIKSFTSVEQSRKLAEILPLESADMGWNVCVDDTTRILPINDWDLVKDGSGDVKFYHAWSLAALLGVLPEGTRLLKSANISSVGDVKYHCDCPKGNIDVWFDNPVDACVAMIEKLNELKML